MGSPPEANDSGIKVNDLSGSVLVTIDQTISDSFFISVSSSTMIQILMYGRVSAAIPTLFASPSKGFLIETYARCPIPGGGTRTEEILYGKIPQSLRSKRASTAIVYSCMCSTPAL